MESFIAELVERLVKQQFGAFFRRLARFEGIVTATDVRGNLGRRSGAGGRAP